MKLPALISFFRTGGSFAEFCQLHGLDQASEVIEIYAKAPASADSELGFFPVEATGGKIEFQSQGVTYTCLFDFFYFLDVMEEARHQEKTSDAELAQRLWRYAVDDA